MEFIFIRTAFLGVSSFTFLNSVNVLNTSLHFPWIVLFIISFGIWLFWEKIYKKKFNFPMLMGSFFALHLYGDTFGNVFELYKKFDWYDKLTHFTGGIVAGMFTLFVLAYFNKKNRWNINPKTLAVFAVSLALSLGVLYEFWEYFAYSVLGHKELIIGETDTSSDLFFGFLGTALSTILLTVFCKKRRRYLFFNENGSKTQ